MNSGQARTSAILGVYDPIGDIVAQLRDGWASSQLIVFDANAGRAGVEQYLADKSLFFNTANHLIVVPRGIEGLSMLTSSLVAVTEQRAHSLLVVTPLDWKPILQVGSEDERAAFERLIESGQVETVPAFNLPTLDRHLCQRGNRTN